MGLCPSRNNAHKAKQHSDKTYTPLEPLRKPDALRHDAAVFVPAEKEPWEKFLDQKRIEQHSSGKQTFARKGDGTFTADYRRLLGKEAAPAATKYVPPHQRPAAKCDIKDDLIKEWKDTCQQARPPAPWRAGAPRPAPGLPKPKPQKTASGMTAADAKLRRALLQVKQQAVSKEAALEQLEGLTQRSQDDLAACAAPCRGVPFGLTDAHYLSDGSDCARSHRHGTSRKSKVRAYAKSQPITSELETAMTNVLHSLRVLRSAELGAALDLPRRYCVGIREVARTLKDKQNCSLKAVLVAPDVEADCVTARGPLDARLAELIRDATALNIPVVYGLSRVRLGQAIKKSVTISVLGILSVRGMQEPFGEMLRVAQ